MIVKLFQPCLNYTKRKAVIFHRYFHRVEGLEWKRLSWSTFMFTIVISQGSVENRIHSSEEKWMKEWIAGSGNRQVIRHWEISNSRKLIPPPSLKGSGEKLVFPESERPWAGRRTPDRSCGGEGALSKAGKKRGTPLLIPLTSRAELAVSPLVQGDQSPGAEKGIKGRREYLGQGKTGKKHTMSFVHWFSQAQIPIKVLLSFSDRAKELFDESKRNAETVTT